MGGAPVAEDDVGLPVLRVVRVRAHHPTVAETTGWSNLLGSGPSALVSTGVVRPHPSALLHKTCYSAGVATLTVRTDEAMEKALQALAEQKGSRTDAVRYALLRTYRETLVEQAEADAERLAGDVNDQAEMLAIQRFMGVVE